MARIVWVTGASRGIGRSVALALASRGDIVAASARPSEELDEVAKAGEGLSGRIVAFPLDITDEEACADTVAAMEDALGPLDVALFNAGTHEPVSVDDFSPRPFRNLAEVNLMGTVNCLSAVLPRFRERQGGRIAVVGSVAGYRGLPSAAAYGATKAALINLCEALKPDLDRHGIRLNLINPGFVRTPLTDRNDFEMPFLMEPDDAAQRIVGALDSDRFETTFPRRFTWMLKVMRCLPYALYFRLTRRLVR